MSALDFAKAPALARPLRWIMSAPVWGVLAGLWLLWRGPHLLIGRWMPETAALAHLFALGVLGNAMFGALLQFLPVAVGCPLRLGRAADVLHAIFNLGLLALAFGLATGNAPALAAAPFLLASAPIGFAAAALPSLLRPGALRAARGGIAFALLALLCTATTGALAALVLRGDFALPLPPLVDSHAALGLLGWVLGLLAAVGSITQPMFQGARRLPDRVLVGSFALAGLALGLGIAARSGADSQTVLALALALPGLLWVLATAGPNRKRGATLVHFWRAGALALGIACLIAPLVAMQRLPERAGLAAGALALGAGFPLLVTGMMLEIVAFLAWIALRRACPRGVRVPGTGLLAPEADKRLVLALHLLSALALTTATLWPDALARAAGGFMMLAHAATLFFLVRTLRRARRFRDGLPSTVCSKEETQ